MDALLVDLRYGARLLLKSPAFTAVAVLALALGVGANTLMFSVVNTVLLRPLPYRSADRLLLVQTVETAHHQPTGTAPPDFYAYRSENRTLDYLAAYYLRPGNLTGDQEPERVPVLIVSSDFFTALGVQPAIGRGFAAGDERWGQHRVVVLSDGLWRRRFGAEPGVVGQTVTLDSESYLVIGVAPAKFSFGTGDAQAFIPMSFAPGDNLNTHNNYFLSMVGRLKPGVTREQATADLNVLSEAIIREHPENAGSALDATPLQEALVQDVRPAILVLMGAVSFVLLIACANIANLLLARAARRRREIAVRAALGAGRGRLLRQFLTESVLLAGIGSAAGLVLASWGVDALNLLDRRVLPRAEELRIDHAVLGFTVAVALFTGVLFGLAPAMHSRAVNLYDSLREGARASGDDGGRHRLRGILVISEIALSLVLLIGAGLMVKSIHRLMRVDAGFDPRNVLTVQISLPAKKYIDARLERQFSNLAYVRSAQFFDSILNRVRPLPGVRAVALINGLPLMGELWGKNVTLYDRPLPPNVRGLPPIQYRVVAGDYFRALGIRMVRGRAFAVQDTLGQPSVAIVNRDFAHRYWNEQNPIGKQISVNPPPQLVPAGTLPPGYQGPEKFTVVGVADDVRYGSLRNAPVPLVYVPYAQGSEGATNMFLVVKSDADPRPLAGAIREQVWGIDRDQPVGAVMTMEDRVGASVAQPRLEAAILGLFAGLAVLLAGIGIYGVMSYFVAQRTREIGIRMAMGAARRDVLAMVLRQGMRLAAMGLGLGIAGALALTRVLRSLLFEVSATDPSVFAAIAALLAAIALLATFLPALRATKVDPMVALRSE